MNCINKITVFVLLLIGVFNLSAQEASSVSETIETTQQEEKGLVEKVTNWYMDNMNYGTVTLLMTIESSFIPFPSEVIVPPAAYKATKPDSDMNIVLVVVFATLGALIGAVINYYLALFLGRPIVYKFAESKLGHMLLLDAKKIETAEKYFDKHGKSSTLIGRLVPAVRQLISIPAGLAKMNLATFLTFTALGAGIWNIILAVLGYLAAGQSDMIEKYSHELSYVLIGLGILFVAYLIFKAIRKKNKK
jgi:membrane protein DedA with SNARE-associated domain